MPPNETLSEPKSRTAEKVSSARLIAEGGMVSVACWVPLSFSASVNVMVPAVAPVWNAMLGWPPMVAVVSPGETLTVATRSGPDRN